MPYWKIGNGKRGAHRYDWMGEKCLSSEQLINLKNYICDILAKRYSEIEIIPSRRCFLLETGEILSVVCVIGGDAFHILTEYADNQNEMRRFNTTDGELYHPDDYETAEDMLKDIVAEIEQTK